MGEPLRYVLGFMFSPSLTEVLLIQKNRPEWQAGKLNGAGGKVEPGEVPGEAMAREFREECGIDTTSYQWSHLLTLDANHPGATSWQMDVFYCIGDIYSARSITDEKVRIEWTENLSALNLIDNNRWLIPLCLHRLKHPHHSITALSERPEVVDAELVSESGAETLHRVVTCVYCGQHYEAGTPTHGAEMLTKHIEKCERHPLRAERAKTARLRDALQAVIMCDTVEEVRILQRALMAGTVTPGSPREMQLRITEAILSTLNPGA